MLFIAGVFNKCLFLARLALGKMYYLEVRTQYPLDKNVVSSKHVIKSVAVISINEIAKYLVTTTTKPKQIAIF